MEVIARYAIAGLLTATGAPADAQAGPDGPPASGPLSIDVGAGAVVYPAFSGADRSKVLPVPSLTVSYKDTVFVAFPDLLRVDALRLVGLRTRRWSAGPRLGLRLGRDVKSNQAYLTGLTDRGDTVEIGGYVAYTLTPALTTRVDVGEAVSGRVGLAATATLAYALPAGPVRLGLGPSVTVVTRGPSTASARWRRRALPSAAMSRRGASDAPVPMRPPPCRSADARGWSASPPTPGSSGARRTARSCAVATARAIRRPARSSSSIG